jgi:hypothetical protein
MNQITKAVMSDEWRVASGEKEAKPERGKGRLGTRTINRAAHTSPHRLSTVSGEKMNPFGTKVISHQFSVIRRTAASSGSYLELITED